MAFDLQSFRKKMMYQGSPSAPQLQANFKQIAAQDKQAEKKKKLYLAIAIVSGVLAFFSVIWVAKANGTATVSILLINVSVVTSVLYTRWGRLDVPDLRYSLPMRLVDLLSRDMRKGAALDTRIDFSKATHKRKQISKGPWPARFGWTQACFEDSWLWLSGEFLDRTKFALTLTELTVVRSGWKLSRSGRPKPKTKTKPKGMVAELSLRFPRKRYGAVTVLKRSLAEAVNLPQGVALRKVKVNDHQLVLSAKIPPGCLGLDGFYQLFAQLLLSAYQILNLSQKLSK